MSLKVIGAGLGRTGTNSLKLALEQLGFTRCHHMIEVLENPQQVDGFITAARGELVNWDKLFSGYQASCDWPSCHFWRELSEFYPEAKVILTVRDAEEWYRSISETLFPMTRQAMSSPESPISAIGKEILLKGCFSGNIDDRDHVIEVFERHNQSVRDSVASERLLEFEVKQGWEPLCEFLGVPVPDEPFPKTNDMEQFRQRLSPAGQ